MRAGTDAGDLDVPKRIVSDGTGSYHAGGQCRHGICQHHHDSARHQYERWRSRPLLGRQELSRQRGGDGGYLALFPICHRYEQIFLGSDLPELRAGFELGRRVRNHADDLRLVEHHRRSGSFSQIFTSTTFDTTFRSTENMNAAAVTTTTYTPSPP